MMQQQPVTLVYLIISLLLVVYSAKLEQLQKNYLLSVRDGNCKKERFIYLFIGIGVLVLFIACCGCIGTTTRNGCCLTCYSVLVILLILVELGAAAFIFFDKSWLEDIPTDRTGNFDMIYEFLKEHWKIAKWVALGIVILEGLIFLLALVVRAANAPPDYDSDEEYIGRPRQQIRQPFMNRSAVPATGVPVVASLDHRTNRNDAWSTRMREKNSHTTPRIQTGTSKLQHNHQRKGVGASSCDDPSAFA